MHPVPVEDCKARGGCCSRDCGYCVDIQHVNTSAGAFGVGHCTRKCGCCSRYREFELDQEVTRAYIACFEFDEKKDTLTYMKDA